MPIIGGRPSIRLLKPRWRSKRPRTLEERASVIGANAWKIANEVFRHMEKEGFRFGSDAQVTAVIAEFNAFLVQLVDRAAYGRLADADRERLVVAVARHLAATVENNHLDLFGPGDYRGPFIDLLNARFDDYAHFEYRDGEPGHACLRFFAAKVDEAMRASGNRWVVEQIMELEAPEMVRLMNGLVRELLEDAAP